MSTLPVIGVHKTALAKQPRPEPPKKKRKRKHKGRKNPFKRYNYITDPHYHTEKGVPKFNYDTHVRSQKPLQHQFPTLAPWLKLEIEHFGKLRKNEYIDPGNLHDQLFHVFIGVTEAKYARFDPFFTKYGHWNEADEILTLHLGMMCNHPKTLSDYVARTMYMYLKYYAPIYLVSNDRMYEITDFYHEYRYPFTHLVHCYGTEIPDQLLTKHWKKHNRKPVNRKHYIHR